MQGRLYIIPTPIGNLKDITVRAIEILKSADIIAAEDTRQTLKLLNHYNIKKPMISYHMHNEKSRGCEITDKLQNGINIALVSDAGMPGISDPGSDIIKKCIEEGISFEVLPGATAAITALIYSGLNTAGFIFKGFLPRENKNRKAVLDDIKDRCETIILYEAPHRLNETLLALKETLGSRKISICRELTKIHEEVLRITVDQAIEYYKANSPKGEFVIVIEGKTSEEVEKEKKAVWENITIEQHIEKYIGQGLSKKEAVKKVASDRHMPKSEVYKFSIDL